MAALAQSLGVVAALPVWLRWRRRSAFVRAHAGQSIAFDGLTMAALVLIAALAVGAALAGNAALEQSSDNDMARLFVVALCAPGLALVGCLIVMLAALILRLRAAMAANEGRLFCYPLLKRPQDLSARQPPT
jgi:uncharacterized Tic20 family protein